MKYIQHFILSAGALLLAAALVSVLGNLAAFGHLHSRDPLLAASMPALIWVFGGVALAIASLCLLGRKTSIQLGAVLWFAIILCIYQIGVLWQIPNGFAAYLVDPAAGLGVSHHLVNLALQSLSIYLMFGSIYFSLQFWLSRSARVQVVAVDFQKIACPACGGRIQFSTANLGQITPCPHCQSTLVLRKLENLKMACFFCKEHIEFPAYAAGTKMACPHCKMHITLKKPA